MKNTLILKIRDSERKEWNEEHNLEEWEEMDFDNAVTKIVYDLVDCDNEYWDSYTAWYDAINTVNYSLNKKITNDTLEKIKDTLYQKESILLDAIYIND
ncbi:hypothetical protein [Clostridium ljungdahlii]|uniref:Uncharacterized protein n=1 Tax=Clostridium ljungdahlii (strain ATCC 55383 / DSM 13528 / PETC) TaxID=748727 RepID=D8GU63_CLOLD|nr:hypothetical protein [Clostridium ljungdahlii]ADK14726.1 hypothetical protein CLJU_c16620 [Clostridium ljungdahlii DSM 13528]OAA84082.1 hypothetical protein WX45_01926 [Clostridium ljungdahlii DSM 13528]